MDAGALLVYTICGIEATAVISSTKQRGRASLSETVVPIVLTDILINSNHLSTASADFEMT